MPNYDPYNTAGQLQLQSQAGSLQQALQRQRNQLGYADLRNQTGIAQLQADVQRQLASSQQQTAQNIAAGNNASAMQRAQLEAASAAQLLSAQNAGALQRTQAEQAGQTERTKYSADEQERLGRYQSDQSLAGTKYSSDQQLQAALAATQEQKYQADLMQGRFNTLFPWLQQQYNTMTSATGNGTSNITATLPQAPTIDVNPVYSGAQIQQRVNATRAQNDQSAATQTRNMQKDLAGRGFGANSPLAMELAAQFHGQGLAANTAAENDLRFNAAGANADQILKAQQAQSGNYQAQLQAATSLQNTKAQQQSALLQALASMTHG